VFDRVHLDLIVLDGTGGETKEGTISIDEVREVRSKVGQPPRGDGHRVVVVTKATGLTEAAANGLLKSLEEPRPGNVFVLLAPQRERLLPTLVSRSWILTLAWPEAGAAGAEDDLAGWLDSLEGFLRTGRGWFERTSAKGQVDRALAGRVVTGVQRCLAEALAGRPGNGLAGYLAQLPLASLRRLDVLLAKGLEALELQVNPALVLDWVATQGRVG
jgi:DNA polymerase-3 subunit delta'